MRFLPDRVFMFLYRRAAKVHDRFIDEWWRRQFPSAAQQREAARGSGRAS